MSTLPPVALPVPLGLAAHNFLTATLFACGGSEKPVHAGYRTALSLLG